MENWAAIVSVVNGIVTIAGFIGIIIKIGKAKGISEIEQKEMRKDIDKNQIDINNLGSKVNQMQIENTRLITTLSSDLGWIKSSLTDIKQEMMAKQGERRCQKETR